MENSLKFITSERGKELAVISSHKYRFIRKRKDGLLKWICYNKSCYASVLTDVKKTQVVAVIGEHKHTAITPQDIEHQELRENCKQKASDSISTRPSKIIRKELQTNLGTDIVYKDISSVRKAMYMARRKNFPINPRSFDEAINKIWEMQNDDIFKFNNKKFVHIPMNKSFICITTEENLNFMSFCTEYFSDGTFQFAPNFFMQMYTVHCLKNGFYLPVIFIFLKDKSKQTYVEMWKFIKELYFQHTSQTLNIYKLHINFEIGAHEAVREVFPNVQLTGCRFHLSQSWWRYINSNRKLRTAYSDNKSILGKWLKMFFGLPFLPYQLVEDGFVELVGDCPDDDGLEFSDYVLKNYIQPNCKFPTNIWAEEPSMNKRITNSPESFHRTFNAQFYSTHPPIYFVIEALKEIQAETNIKISTVQKNISKAIPTEDIQKINHVIKLYDQFKIDGNVLNYLSGTSYQYQDFSL